MSKGTILGIDPGLATTGYGIVTPGDRPRSFHFIASGAIRTDSDEEMSSRLDHIYNEIQTLITEYSPATMAVEEVFYSKNKKTAGLVAQARGVILLAGKGCSTCHYSPLEVKKTVTGYGKATKQQMKLMVQRLLDLDELPQPADAADAMGLALCGGLQANSALHRQTSD